MSLLLVVSAVQRRQTPRVLRPCDNANSIADSAYRSPQDFMPARFTDGELLAGIQKAHDQLGHLGYAEGISVVDASRGAAIDTR